MYEKSIRGLVVGQWQYKRLIVLGKIAKTCTDVQRCGTEKKECWLKYAMRKTAYNFD